MAVYLKEFETQAAYEAAESGLILPNVSLTLDNNAVHYNPSSPVPPTPSHDYVEIGGIKWATMNVGANSVTDPGLYFQWGDTQGYTVDQLGIDMKFQWNWYKYWSNNTGSGSSGMTKYNSTDGKTILEASDDAVTAAWGGNWRMPTTEEYVALGDAVTTAWTADYEGSGGISGLVCTDKTDSSKVLFFPACGAFSGSTSYDRYTACNCWSSSLYSNVIDGYSMGYGYLTLKWDLFAYRYLGFPVRGILDE